MTVFRYIFIVIVLLLVSLSAIYLRRLANSEFYRFRTCQAKQSRLKQELWQQQLRLESLINPARVSDAIKKDTKLQATHRQN